MWELPWQTHFQVVKYSKFWNCLQFYTTWRLALKLSQWKVKTLSVWLVWKGHEILSKDHHGGFIFWQTSTQAPLHGSINMGEQNATTALFQDMGRNQDLWPNLHSSCIQMLLLTWSGIQPQESYPQCGTQISVKVLITFYCNWRVIKIVNSTHLIHNIRVLYSNRQAQIWYNLKHHIFHSLFYRCGELHVLPPIALTCWNNISLPLDMLKDQNL